MDGLPDGTATPRRIVCLRSSDQPPRLLMQVGFPPGQTAAERAALLPPAPGFPRVGGHRLSGGATSGDRLVEGLEDRKGLGETRYFQDPAGKGTARGDHNESLTGDGKVLGEAQKHVNALAVKVGRASQGNDDRSTVGSGRKGEDRLELTDVGEVQITRRIHNWNIAAVAESKRPLPGHKPPLL